MPKTISIRLLEYLGLKDKIDYYLEFGSTKI